MTGASIRIALVAIGVVVAFIVTSAGNSTAEKKSTASKKAKARVEQCKQKWGDCMLDSCIRNYQGGLLDWDEYQDCTAECTLALQECLVKKELGTGTPPKGTNGRAPVDMGVKEPGGGTPPKGTVEVTDPRPPGGVKDPQGGSKPPKGPLVVTDPLPPGGGVKDPGSGVKPPKGKSVLDKVNVGGIKDTGAGSGSGVILHDTSSPSGLTGSSSTGSVTHRRRKH